MLRANQSYEDDRIKSIFALAPAIGHGFTEAGLRDVDVPVLIVVGDADVVTPPATNAAYYAEHLAGSRYTVLPGERGHYTGAISGEQRRAELAEVGRLAIEFFDETLRP